MTEFRTERDTMGEVRLPAEAYYGPQTQRAVENFPISGRTLPPELIHALGLVKWAAAMVNRETSGCSIRSKPPQIDALTAACREVADGKWDHQFPIDVFQTGSGTSSNMNANEVIARRANELSAVGGQRSGVRRGQRRSEGAAHVGMSRAAERIHGKRGHGTQPEPQSPRSIPTTTSTSARAATTYFPRRSTWPWRRPSAGG